MADEVTNNEEVTLELTPEEQKALERVRGEGEDYVDKNFNPDGTPKDTFEMPEKFQGKSAEEIARAYMELEKLKTKQQDSPNTPTETEAEEENTTEQIDDTAKEAEEQANKLLTPKDFKKYEEAYLQEGKLSDDLYKELEQKGLSKEIVDTYIDAQKVKGEVYKKTIYDTAGGEQAYNQMVEWARENLSETQAKRFDQDILSGDMNIAKEAIEVLKLRMGTPPRRIEGQTQGNGLKPFQTRDEYFKAVRNPAYKTDRRYAELVDNRYLAGRQQGLY